jgi:hypothetical protein
MHRRLSSFLLALAACSSGTPATRPPPPDAPVVQAQVTPPGLPPPPLLGPGQSQARVSGCSESPQPSEADAATYPPMVLGSRAPSATEVQLGPQAAGVWVAHNLTHGCCQKARVYVQQLPGQVNFIEAMEGTACGSCMCTSTVRAAVGVPPGRYNVALQLQDTAGTSIVKQQAFVVEAY